MTLTQYDWDNINALALKVARELAAKWEIVEVDDVHQEILLHVAEQQEHIAQYRDDEEFLRKMAWKVGKSYASKEQNYRDLVDDRYYYTPDEVRAVLRSFTFTDAEISGLIGKKDDLTRCRVADNISTARLDAEAGLKKLTTKYQVVLQKIYIYGIPAQDEAERKLSNRAADALAIAMNRNFRKGRR